MKTELVYRLDTAMGRNGLEVFKTTKDNGNVSYRYVGQYGAGCGPIEQAIEACKSAKRDNKRAKEVINFLF